TASARESHEVRRPAVRHEEHNFYREHGHRFSGGYYYPRHDHPVWGRRVWDDHYHRWHYWEPELRIWYYFDPACGCYYPITYCPGCEDETPLAPGAHRGEGLQDQIRTARAARSSKGSGGPCRFPRRGGMTATSSPATPAPGRWSGRAWP